MKKMKSFGMSFVLFLSLVIPMGAWAATFDTVVMFGDSLSDNGNLYEISPGSVDSDYYYEGRFSNGPVWVEYLTGSSLMGGTLIDMAYGGAQSTGVSPMGLVEQVDEYTSSLALPENALFVIWIGANDIFQQSRTTTEIVANVIVAMDDLVAFGAETIMVMNLPQIGSTPEFLGTDSEDLLNLLAASYNDALESALDDFATDNPAVTVYEFDTYAVFEYVIDKADRYGFTNVTQSSPNFEVAGNFDNSAGYFFWDDIHPTTEGHESIAEMVYDFLDNDGELDLSSGDGDSGGCFLGAVGF